MSWYQQRQARTSAYLRDLSAGQKAVRLALAIVGVVVISIAFGALSGNGIDWSSAVVTAIGFGAVMAIILRGFPG